MADATIQQSRYPKVMRQWPLGGSRHGPVDDYPGLTAIRKDHRLLKPTQVPYTTKSKRRTVKTVPISSQDGGTVGVLGINRPWQGNYAHPADKDTSVENLEHIDIETNTLVELLRAHLPKLRLNSVDELKNEDLITGEVIVSDSPQVRTEEFSFLNLSTVRFCFEDIDVLDEKNTAPLKTSGISIDTELENDQLMQGEYGGSAWSLEVEQLAAAEILWGLDDCLPGDKPDGDDKHDKTHRLCVTMAFQLFYKDREFLQRIHEDVEAGPEHYFRNYPESVHHELRQALTDIKHYYPGDTRAKDDYWQLARDQWMAANRKWDHWTGRKIIIALDKNKVLMHWFFAEAVQSLCPPGTLARMDNAIKAYAWLNPVSKAGKRFDVNKDCHLLKNPQHDFQRLEEMNGPDLAVHSAVCGAEHMGAHSEQGRNRILRQEMHQKKPFDDLAGEDYGWTQFEMLQYGAMGIGTKISRFFLELLDPVLFKQYTSHTENIPEEYRVDTVRGAQGKDCFSYRALNFNTHTEDHYDSGDHRRGLAGLQISGYFTGGDFILRDTKQMFEFLPGSQGFVRGALQRHCTREWSGESRFCQVLTVKHRVWKMFPPTAG